MRSLTLTPPRQVIPGTTGWTIDDFADPRFTLAFGDDPYEIVDGVLTRLSRHGMEVARPLARLRGDLERAARSSAEGGMTYSGVELLLGRRRVARPDMLFLTTAQERQHLEAEHSRGGNAGGYHPLYVMPLLVIEATTLGSEGHDRITKRGWYAGAGIAHYWILDERERSLACLALDGGSYREEALGQGNQTVRSAIFQGVEIPLVKLWNG